MTLFSPVVYFVNALLPTSQSTVTLTRLIPKSKNKTDQTLLSPSNTHTLSLSLSRFLTHWGCYRPKFLDLFILGILWVISSKETVELLILETHGFWKKETHGFVFGNILGLESVRVSLYLVSYFRCSKHEILIFL